MVRKASDGKASETVSGPWLAERLGITPTTVSKLGGDGILKRVARGRYELWPSIAGYVTYLRRGATQRESPTHKARARLLAVQAEKAEFELAQERGAWLKESDVIAEYSAIVSQMRARLLALPARMGGKVPSLTLEDIDALDREVRGCLTELADPKSYSHHIVDA